jgi:hypothetical protein
MLKATQQAKDDFMTVTCVAREAVRLSQAFLTNATGGGVHPARSFLSQAKTTLNHYCGGSGRLTDGSATSASGRGRGKQFFACHGCGGPHPWLEFCDGKHIVICANRDNPGMHKNAQRNIDRIKANQKKTSNRTPNGRTWGRLTSPTLTRPVSSKFQSESNRPWVNARSATPLAWLHPSPPLVLLLPPQMLGEAEAVEVGALRVVDHIFLSAMSLFWPPVLLSSA